MGCGSVIHWQQQHHLNKHLAIKHLQNSRAGAPPQGFFGFFSGFFLWVHLLILPLLRRLS
jgi:hypothetical protein